MVDVLQAIQLQQQDFLQPSLVLNTSLVALTKGYLDVIASDVDQVQRSRLKYQRQHRKRKRDACTDEGLEQLGARQVYTNGFGVGQIWQQSKRVLDATIGEVERQIVKSSEVSKAQAKSTPVSKTKSVRFEQEDIDSDGIGDESLGEEGVDWEYDGMDTESDDDVAQHQSDAASEQGSLELDEETSLSDVSEDEPNEKLVKDQHGLNDGFFSIDQFNKNTQFLENVDAKGDNDDGAASDEEEIDWGADPLSIGANIGLGKSRASESKIRDGDEVNEEQEMEKEEEESDDGPTFGDADLNASDSEEDEDATGFEDGDMFGDMGNTNEIMYNDFFAPPVGLKTRKTAKQSSSKPRNKAGYEGNFKPLNLATEADLEQGQEDDLELQRAMSSVKKDLDGEDDVSSDSAEDQSRKTSSLQNLSSHERRMAAFRKEIAQLEKENVANKSWALTGETVAPARPENALLEEDLDFERAGKPLPVITQEVNESIEDLIRRRILNNEFDEVQRRHPELENTGGSGRRGLKDTRGRLEDLSDSKPQKGLAEEYEDDYLQKNDPNYVDQRSEAIKKKHGEIEKQWNYLRGQLDALCNWHYQPRAPEMNLEVRTDAPVVRMEEARPAAEASGTASGLAPQEIYKPGQEGKVEGEIRTTGGTAIAKEEETRENNRRRRRRMKQKGRKAKGTSTTNEQSDDITNQAKTSKASGKRQDREQVVKALEKANVKVIGKKGELQDVDGKIATTNAHGGRTGAAAYML